MSRKKEGSIISGRFGISPRKNDAVSRESRIKEGIKENYVKEDDFVHELFGFIEHYEVAKQNYTYNLSTEHIYTQSTVENEEELNFDVDLGVPYVESHHLDSGYEYDDKSNETIMSFPKISSAKEIFTSVLEIDNQQTTLTLDEENFTDQEEDNLEEPSFASIKSATFKKRSRKLEPKIETEEIYENSPRESEMSINYSRNDRCSEMEMSIVERLKSTVLSRGQKLEYWNQRLVELDESFYYEQEINDLHNSQVDINDKNEFQESKVELYPTKKRSKFEKCSTNKKTTPLVVEVSLNTNKENITPSSRLKFQTKSICVNDKDKHRRHPSKEKSLFQKDTLLNKKTRKSNRSKETSLVKKVY